jgi:2-C-methyl-D-erythritol 4-phosphate cytidylyltransferase/2-C-methyl-D-erythritol 2,4-cyclodiphosphate synthase
MYDGVKVIALIPAAGRGSRMKTEKNKLTVTLEGRPLIEKTLEAFENHDWVDEIIVVTRDVVIEGDFRKISRRVQGGDTRQESVARGLAVIEDPEAYVLVHDGARPYVTGDLISRVIEGIAETGAAIPGVRVKDTVKTVEGNRVKKTLKREELLSVQTPQGFKARLLKEAYGRFGEQAVTDEATLMEMMDQPVLTVEGDYRNIKITTPEDLAGIKGVNRMKIGIGYDVHQLKSHRDLIIGGVKIPYEKGLMGHSDADVLIHAVMDALLGALGEGDIGQHFPDTDEAYKGISSLVLLAKTRDLMMAKGYRILNIDGVVIAQKPKLAPYLPEMAKNIAGVLCLEPAMVNIKATTTEGMGFTGLGEGIAAEAVLLIDKEL